MTAATQAVPAQAIAKKVDPAQGVTPIEQAQRGSFQINQTLGPDSLTWRFFGDYRYHLFLPQAFVMQVIPPKSSAAQK